MDRHVILWIMRSIIRMGPEFRIVGRVSMVGIVVKRVLGSDHVVADGDDARINDQGGEVVDDVCCEPEGAPAPMLLKFFVNGIAHYINRAEEKRSSDEGEEHDLDLGNHQRYGVCGVVGSLTWPFSFRFLESTTPKTDHARTSKDPRKYRIAYTVSIFW